jgi:CBS domain containing-hemolysin-like protein
LVADDSDGHYSYLVILIVASILFLFASFAESALLTVSRARIQRLAERDASAARSIQDFAERPSSFTTSMAIVRLAALVAVTVGAVGAVIVGLPSIAATAIWAGVLLSAVTFGWTVPRAVASSRPEHALLAIAWPVRALTWLLAPLLGLVGGIDSVVSRSVGAAEPPEAPVVTSDELRVMVAASEEEGLIEERERTMIDNILELEDVLVREIMVPRPDVVAVQVTTTVRQAVDVVVRERYSRLPVYRESIDDISGILYGKDLFQLVVDGRLDDQVGSLARPAYFVPESKRCDDLLRELQQQHVHIAIVVDEYGGTSGLVTIEDLLEEIVGEIQDEYDVEEQKIIPEGEGVAIVDGSASIDDVNEALSLDLATEQVDTIGGLVYEKLGRVPIVGDRVHLDQSELTVVGAHGRRVTRVRVRRLGLADDNGTKGNGKLARPDE